MTVPRLAFIALFVVTACSDGEDLPTGPVAQTVSEQLHDLAFVSSAELEMDHELYQLLADAQAGLDAQLCNQIQVGVDTACSLLTEAGVSDSCGARASYFLIGNTPRCAVRIELVDSSQIAPGVTPFSRIFAFDLTGRPIDTSDPSCGNGILETGEECDDGNADVFDGCDSQCFVEPFNGCEGIIQAHYEQAQIASIDQSLWIGPRSHLMVHQAAKPMRAMSAETCNAAGATAVDVCNELTATMPHVFSCAPSIDYFDDDRGDACAVRFTVYFSDIDPASGTYTTELPGILAFTLR